MAVGNGRKSEEAGDDSLEPPAGVADPLLWRSAQRVLASHSADLPGNPCPACGAESPCPPRQLAERAIAVARDAALPAGLPKLPASSGGPAPHQDVSAPAPDGPEQAGAPTAVAPDTEAVTPEPTAAAAASEAADPGTSTLPRPRASAPKGRRPSPRPRTVTA